MPESPYPMVSVAKALEIVLTLAVPLPASTAPLTSALGLVLAQDIVAAEPLPPFPAAVKDGYAVIAADGPGVYPIIGAATAGQLPAFTVSPGTVAYITTGAPLPRGADAVVMVEKTEPMTGRDGEPQVQIHTATIPGADIRPVGVDVAAGEHVLAAGTRLGAAELGMLATVGRGMIPVHPQPRIAILSTGDELVDAKQSPGAGQIRDSNRPTLRAAAQATGATILDLGISADAQDSLAALIDRGLREADVLLTSGGVSMGDLDFVKPILEHAGSVHFGRIQMKPGKPLTFATAEVDGKRRLIFGLPGNPVSSLVTFHLFVVPALRKLAGWPDPHLRRVQAVLAHSLPLDPERPEYHRAIVCWDSTLHEGRGGLLATSTGSQASSRLLSMRSANALLVLPAAEGMLATGETVDTLLIGDIG